jgi:phosphotransferase system HPr (HPr) family protein
MSSPSPHRVERELVVPNAEGIHARPAAQFVRCARSFDCEIHILKDGQEYDARSIVAVLTANLNCGDRFILCADGPRAAEAIETMSQLVAGFET